MAYWLAVITVACVLVVLLLIFLESRDQGSVGGSGSQREPVAAGRVHSNGNVDI